MTSTKIEDGLLSSFEWVEIDKMLVEYNPKRYHLYASLFPSDKQGHIRDMALSPMYEFIKEYADCRKNGQKFYEGGTRYYTMQELYGREHPMIIAKMSNFIKLFEDILKNGVNDPPVVIAEEGGKFQIRDGHHRIACCMAVNQQRIVCRIIKGRIK